jgi:tetraacyldisaccharide 4'-kinase
VVVMPASDLDDRVLPAGRLREPVDAASSADCLLVPGSDDDRLRVSTTFDRMPVFRVQNDYAPLQGPDGPLTAVKTAVAVAGIARPERFFTALRERGVDVVRALSFPDHHWYTRRDLDRIRAVARQSAADIVVTTEKDAVRLPRQPGWAVLPMRTAIEPISEFTAWLRDRL